MQLLSMLMCFLGMAVSTTCESMSTLTGTVKDADEGCYVMVMFRSAVEATGCCLSKQKDSGKWNFAFGSNRSKIKYLDQFLE